MAVYRMIGGTFAATDADVIEVTPLTGVPPGDFNPAAISDITVEYTLAVTNLADDTWTENRTVTFIVGGVTVIDNEGLTPIDRGLGVHPFTYTATNIPVVTEWTLPTLDAGTGVWAAYLKNKSADGTTATISQVDLIINYAPFLPPTATFTAFPRVINPGQAVQFTDTSSDTPTAWLWDFGGGATASVEQNPLVTFPTVGTYNVTLTASNAYGENTSAPTTITVRVREAEIWNGSAWVGGESWNGEAWVTPEVWDGTQWLPIKTPA